MKKAFDQTVRDLKREVNIKVLKVPSIEQKTLDATSNEPWGPRGSLVSEIAEASCNYNDYQLIMAVLWKRIQDTGKNWRHVYKALSVLEYLAIYGSERAVVDIRDHAYQISTLSGFLYTDSNGRDQGSSVRRKSQSLVALVNNKKRLEEVRHKAFNDNIRLSRPPLSSSARFEGGNRDANKTLSGSEKYSQGRHQYLKDNHEFYSRDDTFRVHANDDYQYRPRSHSVDGCANISFDDYNRHSARIDAPPSYEVASKDSWSDVQNDKDRGTAKASMPKTSSPSSSGGTNLAPGSVDGESARAREKEVASFDEFDPQGSVSAIPIAASMDSELDIFGLPAVNYTDSSASMLVTSDDMLSSSTFVLASTAHAVPSEPDENPFGDAPFKAISRDNFPSETNTSTSQAYSGFVNTLGEPIYALDYYSSEISAANSSKDILDGILPWAGPVASVPFQEFSAYSASHAHSSSETGSENLQISQLNPFEQPGPSNPFEFQAFQPAPPSEINQNQMNSTEIQPSSLQGSQASRMVSMDNQWLSGQIKSLHAGQSTAPANHQVAQINNISQPGLLTPQISPQTNIQPFPVSSQASQQASSSNTQAIQSSFAPHSALPISSQEFPRPQPSDKKFEPKSAIWADTISRGLVNLNISGPRINPLADIGIDFDDINRKEKRNEVKSSQSPLPSSSAMGKAMGAGSSLGRAGTGTLTHPPYPPSMGMAMNQPYMRMGMGTTSMDMMRPSSEIPQQGHGFPGAHNPMNARGGYGRGRYS